jgi:Protein of unknown function (DUF1761)
MFHVSIDYVAVVLAAVAAWIVGGIWYGAFGRSRLSAFDKVKTQFVGRRMLPLALFSFVADLVMAFVLAHAIAATGSVTIANGAAVAAFLWLGFVATTIVVGNRFSGRSTALTLNDAGLWLVAIVAAGVVIGAFG